MPAKEVRGWNMPRSCADWFDETLLSGFLDGVITLRERQIVRTHLLACRECRRLLSELGEIRQACLETRVQQVSKRPSRGAWHMA